MAKARIVKERATHHEMDILQKLAQLGLCQYESGAIANTVAETAKNILNQKIDQLTIEIINELFPHLIEIEEG